MSKSVSIIMGIYNCQDTLDEAIKSILNQTYTDWIMIMCDDCSRDNTFAVAEKYCRKYPEKFVLLKNDKNMGLNYTLNKCLSLVDTEYVARMDADDISLPSRIEKEFQFLENNPSYQIVGTQMVYFDENGEWGKSSCTEIPKKRDLVKGTPFCHATCMLKTEAYKVVNGYSVDKKLLRVEDYHLWIKMYEKGFKGYNLQEILYKMRDDRAATNRRTFRNRINEAYVKDLSIKAFNLPKWNYIYVLKPIILGLLPKFLYEYLHKKYKEQQ